MQVIGATYEESCHELVPDWNIFHVIDLRQREHDVQQCDEAGGFHCNPADFAWDIPARLYGRLAHGIPFRDPLEGSELWLDC